MRGCKGKRALAGNWVFHGSQMVENNHQVSVQRDHYI